MLPCFIFSLQLLSCVHGLLQIDAVDVEWINRTLMTHFFKRRYDANSKVSTVNFIKQHFQNLSMEVRTQVAGYMEDEPKYLKNLTAVNVIGIVKGYGIGNPGHHFYVVGSNYDTPHYLFNEDAYLYHSSGIVGLLEAARLIQASGQKEHTLVFTAFDMNHYYHKCPVTCPKGYCIGDGENYDRYQCNECCIGAKRFIDVWIPDFINEISQSGSKATFGGAVFLDTILNFQDGEYMQNVPGVLNSLPDITGPIYNNDLRGDFIFVIHRSAEEDWFKIFGTIWNYARRTPAFNILSLNMPQAFDNPFSYQYIRKVGDFPSDLLRFYEKRYSGMVISDTGKHRGFHTNCKSTDCLNSGEFCNQTAMVCPIPTQHLQFASTAIYGLVMTMEILSNGSESEEIKQLIRSIDSLPSTTPITYTECRKDIYTYEESIDLYYKLYVQDAYSDRYRRNWYAAKEHCERDGAELLFIKNNKIHQHFKYIMSRMGVSGPQMFIWIGMNDGENEGKWHWNDGSNVTLHEGWEPCQPGGYIEEEDCGAIRIQTGLLKDENCNRDDQDVDGFICACNKLKNEEEQNEENGICDVDGYNFRKGQRLIYKVYNDRLLNWTEASQVCTENNVTLLMILNLQESSVLPRILDDMETGRYFLGITFENGQWQFADKTVLLPEFYPYFDLPKLKNESDPACGVIVKKQGVPVIDVENCSYKLPFVCGKSCSGEKWSPNYISIVAEDIPDIIVSTENSIQILRAISVSKMQVLYQFQVNETVHSLDGDLVEKIIVWHSRKTTFILRHNYESKNEFVKVVKTFDPYTDIVVDWSTRNIYWTSLDRGTISVTRMDWSISKILYSNLQEPRDLHLNGWEGLLYWRSTFGVMSAGMNGDQNNLQLVINRIYDRIVVIPDEYRSVFVNQDEHVLLFMYLRNAWKEMSCIEDLASVGSSLGVSFTLIYTVNRNVITIYNRLYKRHVLVYHSVHAYRAIKVLDDFYDRENGLTFDALPCYINNGNCSYFCLNSGYGEFSCSCYQDNTFISEKSKSCDYNICLNSNGGCSHICSRIQEHPFVQCSCPENYFLISDKKTCIDEESGKDVLLFVENGRLSQLWPLTSKLLKAQIQISRLSIYEQGGLDYDPVEKMIYWVTPNEFKISKAYIHGSEPITAFDNKNGKELRSITLDWLNRRVLYIVPTKIIAFAELDSKSDGALFTTDCLTMSINYDVFNGYVYYSESCNTHNEQDIMIYRARYDGSYKTKLVSNIEHIHLKHEFEVDFLSGFIIWIGGKSNEFIEKTTLTGSHRARFGEGAFDSYNALTLIGTIGYISNGYFLWSIDTDDMNFKAISANFLLPTLAGLKGAMYSEIDGGDNNCTESFKCIGHGGQTKCLTPKMICDGFQNCYGGFDEMYCSKSKKHSTLSSVQLTCNPSEDHAEFIQDKLVLEKSSTSFLMNFISYEDLFHSSCTLVYQSVDVLTKLETEFSLYGFHEPHRLRQIMFSDILSQTETTESCILSGMNILQSSSGNHSHFAPFLKLKNLTLIDIGLTKIFTDMFLTLGFLKYMHISTPAITQVENGAFNGLDNLLSLTITGTKVQILNDNIFGNISFLLHLNFSNNKIQILQNGLLDRLISLDSIDLRNNRVILTSMIFSQNRNLKFIYGDTYALCCIKPESVTEDNCYAPMFDVSSCTDMIEKDVLRAFLWILGIAAFLLNLFVMIFRPVYKGSLAKDSFSVFVGNLCFSDFIMALYILMIASVDVHFRGEYVWKEYNWRNSKFCKALGILSVISMQASVIFIALITIDRYILVKYPFKEVKISRKNAAMASLFAWLFATSLAIVPAFMFEDLFSVSGLCVSLPLTQGSSPAWMFSFTVFVVLNFLTFVFIAIAQWPIYATVKKTISKVRSKAEVEDIKEKLSERLTIVVVTDCLCWIPIGFMGIMAISGYDIPRDVYAWTVVFVLPLNSAINPFIYTLSEIINIQYLRQKIKTLKRKHAYGKCKGYIRKSILLLLLFMIMALTLHQLFWIKELISRHNESVGQLKGKTMILELESNRIRNITDVILQLEKDLVVSCNTPPNLKFGGISYASRDTEKTIGSNVTYECWGFYKSNGKDNTVICQKDGTWTSLQIECFECRGRSKINSYDTRYKYMLDTCFYLIINTKTDYFQSEELCRYDGSQLPVIETVQRKETYFIATKTDLLNTVREHVIWVDGRRSAAGGLDDWYLSNGARIPSAFIDEGSNLATIGIEACVAIKYIPPALSDKRETKVYMVARPCLELNELICEYISAG